ncbi:hypothetical protein FRC04_008306 [Tulasnella sp. 424]|nr:hypothetical protein FRC04_008306 [Tulasnella sp. 424]KAG8970280.1 hypothetical protein FRC05_000654 [Tulasnella sp. 425]
MTITIQIASHPSNPYTPPGPAPSSPQQLLNGLGREYSCTENGIVQESVPESDLEYLTPHRNGFLRTILDAYAGHHHVVLRPDDLWIAVLAQLNYYFHTHPDAARAYFLPNYPEGSNKKEIPISFIGSADTVNIAVVVNQMTRDLQAQIADPTYRDFILPTFSTTGIEDKIICAVMMLASVDTLFDISVALMCGIPSITLLGTQLDWENILNRIKPIAEGKFGNEARHWGQTLCLIFSKFVTAASQATGTSSTSEWRGGDDKEFWENIVKFQRGAGPDGAGLIGGWFTAFGRWGPTATMSPPGTPGLSGQPARPKPIPEQAQHDSLSLPTDPSTTSEPSSSSGPHYISEGLKFPTLSPSRLPSALCSLSLTLTDNGRTVPTRILAGHMGKTWLGVKGDTLQPCSAWIMYVPGVNSETPGGTSSGSGGGAVAKEKMKKAVRDVMLRSKSGAEDEKASAASSSVSFPAATQGQTGSRWKRLVSHTRKLSEKFVGGSPSGGPYLEPPERT